MFTNAALGVLENNLAIEGYKVRITADLEPDVYQEVRDAFVRFGARYKGPRGKNEHFLFPVEAGPVIDTMRATGEANALDFYGTPAAVAEDMLDLIAFDALPYTARILEPSAGIGSLLDALLAELGTSAAGRTVDAVDVNPAFCERLRARYAGHGAKMADETRGKYTDVRLGESCIPTGHLADCAAFTVGVHEADFLTWESAGPYQLIVMNPPFNADGRKDVYIDHIIRAWGMLSDDGVLVAVTPTGWTFGEVARESRWWGMNPPRTPGEFQRFVMEYGGWLPLEDGAFKESGTGSRQCVVILQKGDKTYADLSYERSMGYDHRGYINGATCEVIDWLNNGELSRTEAADLARIENAKRWGSTDKATRLALLDGGASYDRAIARATGPNGPEVLFDHYGHLARGRVDWAGVVRHFQEVVAENARYEAENKDGAIDAAALAWALA